MDGTIARILGDILGACDGRQKDGVEYESIIPPSTATTEMPVSCQPITTPADQPIKTDGCPTDASDIVSASLSYDLLIALHERGRANINIKTIRNEISSLRRLIACLGESGADDCRWMADQKQFDTRVASCILQPDRGWRSALNQVRRTACARVALSNPANSLWESYQRAYFKHINIGGKAALMSKNGFILHCFNATGIPRRRLNARKILVHGATFDRIKDLEESLGADGELTRWLINMSDNHMRKFQTRYGKRLGEASQFHYALDLKDMPAGIVGEWKDLFLMRTEPLKASRKWNLHFENVPKKKLYRWRVRRSENRCPSADKQCRELECFLGWCLLPREILPNGNKNLWRSGLDKTINKKDLSLALIADQELFDGYIAFRMAHTVTEAEAIAGEVGRFNRSCKTFIEFTSSLLNPRTGFVYLRKDLYFRPADTTSSATNLAAHVGDTFYKAEIRKTVQISDPDERWYYYCKSIRDYMEKTRDQDFDPSFKTRGTDQIANILSLIDPAEAIAELLQRLEEAEPVVEYWSHFHRRKRLFFMVISNCPLRILQFAIMTGRHLVKVQSAGLRPFYQIRFRKEEFKNERYILESDYSFDLHEDLTSFIDSYFENDWPAINGRPFTSEERVFSSQSLDLALFAEKLSEESNPVSKFLRACLKNHVHTI